MARRGGPAGSSCLLRAVSGTSASTVALSAARGAPEVRAEAGGRAALSCEPIRSVTASYDLSALACFDGVGFLGMGRMEDLRSGDVAWYLQLCAPTNNTCGSGMCYSCIRGMYLQRSTGSPSPAGKRQAAALLGA
eukprot:764634-Hanusia_phi.AAC.1